MSLLFEGLRVIDLSTVLAGPSVAMFFAELGASVIKVENPRTGGDITRTWKLPVESADTSVSAYFASVNYRKKIIWLDLTNSACRQELLRMIRETDVLITNFKFGDAEKFGLSDRDLAAIHPGLIHGKITGFSGMPERVAFDVVLQAETGFMGMNGTPETGPVKMPVAMIDVLAAHQLKEGLLCALIERGRTGKGQVVRVSLEQAGIASLANQASNYLMAGAIAKPSGSLHPNIAPYGEAFVCGDGHSIVLAIGSDKQFAVLSEILGKPGLAQDQAYASNPSRVIHRTRLSIELGPLFLPRTASEWMEDFIRNHVPAGIIKTMNEVFENPEAIAMIREEEIDGTLTRRVTSIAFECSPLTPEV